MLIGTPVGTVLVVDDEAMVRRMAVLALEGAGYRVLTAGDAAEAEDICRDHQGPIDVVVMDVILENAHGFDAVPCLQALRADMKVVYMSGYPGQMLFERLGISAPFLSKPFTPEELVGAVADAAGHANRQRFPAGDPRRQPIA